MKIAYIVDNFPSISQTFILNQITGLIDLGKTVDIFSLNKPDEAIVHSDVEKYNLELRTEYLQPPKRKATRFVKGVWLLFINFYKSPIKLLKTINIFRFGNDAISFRLLFYTLPFLKKDYDIIHCHFGPNGNIGALLKQIGVKGKLITTFHGYGIRRGLQRGKQLYKSLFEIGDLFLAVSDYSYRNLLLLGLSKEKIIFHKCGISLDEFVFRKAHQSVINRSDISIITVARLVPEKGILYGIKAINILLDKFKDLNITYTIIGGGPLMVYLASLINELGLDNHIQIIGSKTRNQVIQFLNESDIFLLPSIQEALPVALLEAQAVGLPVVATEVGSTNQAIVVDKSGYLVPPRNENALAEKLSHLISNPGIRAEMGCEGRQYVAKNFNIKKLNQKLLIIFESLLDGS